MSIPANFYLEFLVADILCHCESGSIEFKADTHDDFLRASESILALDYSALDTDFEKCTISARIGNLTIKVKPAFDVIQ